mmetsp:Transcript_24512/g.38582  ORF Transcript_24512/g.38582 Transcript_24512/m.38582 type:complete len:96 (+) Transcript_24512:102-389(+)
MLRFGMVTWGLGFGVEGLGYGFRVWVWCRFHGLGLRVLDRGRGGSLSSGFPQILSFTGKALTSPVRPTSFLTKHSARHLEASRRGVSQAARSLGR